MHVQTLKLLSLGIFGEVYGHLFVGNPPPFRADQDITRLIMPLNGDPNVSPLISQQPFLYKGHHQDLDSLGSVPVTEWYASQTITFS
jgi:hypothetical protein